MPSWPRAVARRAAVRVSRRRWATHRRVVRVRRAIRERIPRVRRGDVSSTRTAASARSPERSFRERTACACSAARICPSAGKPSPDGNPSTTHFAIRARTAEGIRVPSTTARARRTQFARPDSVSSWSTRLAEISDRLKRGMVLRAVGLPLRASAQRYSLPFRGYVSSDGLRWMHVGR